MSFGLVSTLPVISTCKPNDISVMPAPTTAVRISVTGIRDMNFDKCQLISFD
ncbi:MAG: hypothetical protein ACLTSM_08725 [Eubacterium sp.]